MSSSSDSDSDSDELSAWIQKREEQKKRAARLDSSNTVEGSSSSSKSELASTASTPSSASSLSSSSSPSSLIKTEPLLGSSKKSAVAGREEGTATLPNGVHPAPAAAAAAAVTATTTTPTTTTSNKNEAAVQSEDLFSSSSSSSTVSKRATKKSAGCDHSFPIIRTHCSKCGEVVDAPTVAYGHQHDSVATFTEAGARRLQATIEKRLLKDKKLILALDLDACVIHATNEQLHTRVKEFYDAWDFDRQQQELIRHAKESIPMEGRQAEADSSAMEKSIHRVQVTSGRCSSNHYVKVRPGVHAFLHSLKDYFEFHIYTHGSRAYAEKIAHLLDPKREVFGHNLSIVSRDDVSSGNRMHNDGDVHGSQNVFKKSLQRLLPVRDNMAVVVDDRLDVWENQKNVIDVAKYDFWTKALSDVFAPRNDGDVCAARDKIRRRVRSCINTEKDRQMRSITIVLRAVHKKFFLSPPPANRLALDDAGSELPVLGAAQCTSELLQKLHARVLRGCSVAFRNFLSSRRRQQLGAMAMRLGAAFDTEFDRLEGLRSFQDAAVRRMRDDPAATDIDRATVRSGLKGTLKQLLARCKGVARAECGVQDQVTHLVSPKEHHEWLAEVKASNPTFALVTEDWLSLSYFHRCRQRENHHCPSLVGSVPAVAAAAGSASRSDPQGPSKMGPPQLPWPSSSESGSPRISHNQRKLSTMPPPKKKNCFAVDADSDGGS